MLDREQIESWMPLQKFKTKKFKTKSEAVKWAKDQKEKLSGTGSVKWETNRLDPTSEFKWEAVIYAQV